MRGKRGMKWTKSQTAMPLDGVTEIPIMKAVGEAVLVLEEIVTQGHANLVSVRDAKNNLVRALGDLQKLRGLLGDAENSIGNIWTLGIDSLGSRGVVCRR